jgi:hypothetical protein
MVRLCYNFLEIEVGGRKMDRHKPSAQEAYLDFLENYSGRWNNFDGPRIVADLKANRHLWNAVCMAQNPLHPWAIGIILREFQYAEEGKYAVDTLYILTESKHILELDDLTRHWQFDEKEIISDSTAVSEFIGMTIHNYPLVIYSLWWD